MKRPDPAPGLRHLALRVTNLEACERFYCDLLGMRVDWKPDADNVYLTSGTDNLALHRATDDVAPPDRQRLDHIGFAIAEIGQVDDWCAFLKSRQVKIVKETKTHRDGTRSFYCLDPDGNVVQLIYLKP